MTDQPPLAPRHVYICNLCGSDQVTRDAWAEWDAVAQGWVLGALFDHAYCHRCLGSARLEQVTLTSSSTFSAPEG